MPAEIEEQHNELINLALAHLTVSYRFHRWRKTVTRNN